MKKVKNIKTKESINYGRFKRTLFELNDSTVLETIFDKETGSPFEELIKVNYVKKEDLEETELNNVISKKYIRIHSDNSLETMGDNFNSKWYHRYELDGTYYDIMINNLFLFNEFVLKLIIDNFYLWKQQVINLVTTTTQDKGIYLELIGLKDIITTLDENHVVGLVKEFNIDLGEYSMTCFQQKTCKGIIKNYGENPFYILLTEDEIDDNENDELEIIVENRLLQLNNHIIEYLNKEYNNMSDSLGFYFQNNSKNKEFLKKYVERKSMSLIDIIVEDIE